MDNSVLDLLKCEENGNFPKQRTEKWYEIRNNMITASEVSSVLECNIHQTSYDTLLRKLSPMKQITNQATEWGNRFEPVAIQFYEYLQNKKVYQLGLVTHSKYSWLGASPDGLLLSGKLLEIKCPIYRNITDEIPLYYWIQMQIQMEVCDMPECDYFECKFYQYANKEEYDNDTETNAKNYFNDNKQIIYYKFVNSNLKRVKRDPKWFKENIQKLQSFYDKMLYYRSLPNGIEQLRIDSKGSQKRKREKLSNGKNKIQKLELINWDYWVSATKIRNYMIDDPIIDYLELYYNNDQMLYHNNSFQNCIMVKGIEFENKIITLIKNKFPNSVTTISTCQQAKSHYKFMETITHMKRGTPIIYQGVLHDYNKRIFGTPDLLVRSDYLNKLFNIPIISNKCSKKSGLNKKYHYRVIEIKFITLTLCADGVHLRNSTKNILANKGQVYIYNKILGYIQNYTPTKAYILGKRWQYCKNSEVKSGESFDRPGHINFKTNDKFIRSKTARAIKWIRKLQKKGSKFTLIPPSCDELKPNMCSINDKWQSVKKRIANETNEITELWMCGINNRKIAENRGIQNWRTHKNLTTEHIGITGNKVANTLQLIIEMNQDTEKTEPYLPLYEISKEWLISPMRIRSNMFSWKKFKGTELFIDFETIADSINENTLTEINYNAFIFMIGVGVVFKDQWLYQCFIAKDLTYNGEKEILTEFHKFIDVFDGKKNIYHWGSAEQYLYHNAMLRHKDILDHYNLITDWCDLLKLFKEEPIVVRGMLNFSLKSVVKAFYDNAFINTCYNESEISNGLVAMVEAYDCYTTNNINSKIMTNIQKYNEIDCKVLYEILDYLKRNH